MKPIYWLIASVVMGIIIGLWGSGAFLCLIVLLWGGGGICYLISLWYKRDYEEVSRRPPGRYGHSYKRAKMALYDRCAEIYDKRAQTLMWLGCIAIIEALILTA